MEVDKGPYITISGVNYYFSDMNEYEKKRFMRMDNIRKDIDNYNIKLDYLKEIEEQYYKEIYASLKRLRK